MSRVRMASFGGDMPEGLTAFRNYELALCKGASYILW
jgi:hypothetical protein